MPAQYITIDGIALDLGGNDLLMPYIRRLSATPDEVPPGESDGSTPRAAVSVRTDDTPASVTEYLHTHVYDENSL